MKLPAALERYAAPIAAEVQANPRLRWMLFAVGCITLLYLGLVSGDWRAELAEDYRRIAMREARLATLADRDSSEVARYYEAQQQANEALRDRFWVASSQGLAGADLQTWLRQTANQVGVDEARIELSEIRPVPGLQSPLWKLNAEMTGALPPGQMRELIDVLANHERVLVIDRLSYNPRNQDRMAITFIAYFLIGSEAAGSP